MTDEPGQSEDDIKTLKDFLQRRLGDVASERGLIIAGILPYTKISGMILPLRLTFRLPFAALRLTRHTFFEGGKP